MTTWRQILSWKPDYGVHVGETWYNNAQHDPTQKVEILYVGKLTTLMQQNDKIDKIDCGMYAHGEDGVVYQYYKHRESGHMYFRSITTFLKYYKKLEN
jgi:hypothetical protein